MKKIALFIICFFIGFFATALITSEPNILIIKAKIFFGAIIISTILLIIDDFKNK